MSEREQLRKLMRKNENGVRIPKDEYPICPRCGGSVVGAMMTSGSVVVDGITYYRPKAVSVYCESGDCNYDQPLANLKNPSNLS
jgi:hypothetical protein